MLTRREFSKLILGSSVLAPSSFGLTVDQTAAPAASATQAVSEDCDLLIKGGTVIDPGQQLHAPLDVVVVRKLGVPWEPELAMGAIVGSTPFLDEKLIVKLGISDAEVERIVAREKAEIERRENTEKRGPAESGSAKVERNNQA